MDDHDSDVSSDSSEDEDNAIVIDGGSHTIKAGLSGQDYPKVVFPSVVGQPPYLDVLEEMGLKGQENRYVVERILSKWTDRRGLITPMTDLIQQFVELKHRYVGDEALKMSELLSMKSPIQNGVADNWDDMVCVCAFGSLPTSTFIFYVQTGDNMEVHVRKTTLRIWPIRMWRFRLVGGTAIAEERKTRETYPNHV